MRARASEDLRRQIEKDISEGRLNPGDKLDEQMLSQRFSVSRTPAREALLQLAADGLVRFKARQGAVVTGLSPQLAIGMVEVLTALEAEAAGLAARRMADADRRALRQIHASSRAAVDEADFKKYVTANGAFHAAIYVGARNPYLEQQVTQTRLRMRFFRHHSLTRISRLQASWNEHERVLLAIEAGDETGAQQGMRVHISDGGMVFADMVASLRLE